MKKVNSSKRKLDIINNTTQKHIIDSLDDVVDLSPPRLQIIEELKEDEENEVPKSKPQLVDLINQMNIHEDDSEVPSSSWDSNEDHEEAKPKEESDELKLAALIHRALN